MKLETAIKEATKHLLKSERARTYTAGRYGGVERRYTLEIERDKNWLTVTTWGFDYEGIKIPKSWPELIALKCRAQMAEQPDPMAKIALRYYLDILYRESN